MSVKKKQFNDEDVYTAATRRIDDLFHRFDRVAVSFSGGKDSTVALQLTLEVAHRLGKTPVDVYFFDEECIHPETIEYVERVRQRDDVSLYWYCLPMKRGNSCSRKERWWYPWDSTKRHLWVREMPECAITELPGFHHSMSTPQIVPLLYPQSAGRVAHIRGLRADESMNRYRSVAARVKDNWISGPFRTYWSEKDQCYELAQGGPKSKRAKKNEVGGGNSWFASPIYDWTTADVWVAPWQFGWDYNRAYDVMSAAGIAPHDQRVCVPFGEEPLRGLYQYAQCWPHLWDAMTQRVHGANTAAKYANTSLYGAGKLEPPDGMTWRKWLWSQLDMYDDEHKARLTKTVNNAIRRHREKTGRSVPDETPDNVTGISWKFLCFAVIRGDALGRTMSNMTVKATEQREREGISYEEAIMDR